MDSILNYTFNINDDYYYILGCDELSTTEQILTEYKIRVLDCHPDKNPDDPHSAKKFSRLLRAKETLVDPESRKQYDAWKCSGIAIQYEQYSSMKDSVKTSMHWASKTKKEPMIEATTSTLGDREMDASCTVSSQSGPSNIVEVERTESRSRPENWIKAHWERDPPSEMLRKFRNYEI